MAVALAVTGLVLSPLTLIILERHAAAGHKQGVASSLLSAYKKPIVLDAPGGRALRSVGPRHAGAADEVLRAHGQVAGDRLFLTGLILSAQKIRLGKSVAIQTLLANIISTLFCWRRAWPCSSLCRRSPPARRSCRPSPAGFFGILFGLRFGVASEVTGTTLVVSTILSAVTLSAAIYFTDGMGPAA